MKIHFVGHACIVVECGGASILMDPWFFGKIFNNSWTLLPEPVFDRSLLEKIDYIWISHEHPDHCHFPTLDSLPPEFKNRVTILFQNRDCEKMLAAFRQIGYEHHRLLPHREIVPLGDASGAPRVYCYHAGLMDSALAVLGDGQVIFNGNDARISPRECRLILKDIDRVDLLLNQFSIAGYAGFEPHEKFLAERARRILENVSASHRALGAKATVPFASFMYFSSVDNKYVNRFANTARSACDYLASRGQQSIALYPGDIHEVGAPHDSAPALSRYDSLPGIDDRPYDSIESKPMEEIAGAYQTLAEQIRERYPAALLKLLRTVTVRIPDLGKTIAFRLADGSLRETDDPAADLEINSQPLWFGFKFPFGIQTLGVSARFRLFNNFRNWKFHRILFALNNGGIYLRPKYLLTAEMFDYVRGRISGGLVQAIHYYRTSL
jgi:hypothetical protein